MLLSKVMGWLKMNSAKRINLARGTPGRVVWLRGYYDHVVRNEAELQRIRRYIVANPVRWWEDTRRCVDY
jgi:REP element-mobilizing transposase RayT